MANKDYNTITTKVVVNPDGTTSGLRTVEQHFDNFSKRMQGALAIGTSNAASFSSAINAVVLASNTLNQSSQNWLGTVTQIGTGFAMGGGIGAGIGAITALANHIAHARDRTEELSAEMENAINTANTFGLTVKEFGDIKFAGLVEGVNPDRLEKLLIAASEVAADADKLGKIGLNKSDLAGKDQYEQLLLVIDAWKKATETAKGMLEVMDQVGKKNFAALNPLIQLGSEGIGKSAAKFPSLPGYVSEAIDKMGDEQTVINELKKRDEAINKYRAYLQRDESWWQWLIAGPELGALAREREMQDSQLQDIKDRREKQRQKELQEEAKRAEYSLRGNAGDFGPSAYQFAGNAGVLGPFDEAGIALRQLEQDMRTFGVSATNPIMSTLAGGMNLGTFQGQAELQRMLNREGGGQKSIEEKRLEVEKKRLAQEEKTRKDRETMIDLIQKGKVPALLPAPAF